MSASVSPMPHHDHSQAPSDPRDPLVKHVLKGVYFWSATFVITAVLYTWCLLRHLRVVLTGAPRDGRTVHAVAALWGRSILRLMPGWHVTLEGLEHLPKDGTPMVIVANHESMADISAMFFLHVQFRWLSKDSIFKIPLIGGAMRYANYVPIKRGNRDSHAEAMRECEKRLDQGLCMFFFPEGTRSADRTLKPFKIGAFKLAAKKQVPILPVAIHGAGELMPKGSAVPRDKVHIRVKVLPALPPPSLQSDERLESYAAMVRELIVTAHNSIQ